MFKNGKKWAPLPIRLITGGSVMVAGFIKLVPVNGPGYQNIVHEFMQLGAPATEIIGYMVGIIEFLTGLALVLGALTRLVATINLFNLVSVFFMGLMPNGIPEALPDLQYFPYQLPGYYLATISIAGVLSLLISGAGALSIDGYREARRTS